MAAQKSTLEKMLFWYVTPVIASLAPGISTSVAITFDQDATFHWHKTTYMVDLAGAAITDSTRPIPLISANMLDTGSGRNLFFSAAPVDSFAGYKASEAYVNTLARKFSPSATLRLTFTNYSAATTYTNFYMTFHGYKEFT